MASDFSSRVPDHAALECASLLALCGRRRSRGGFTVAMRTDAVPDASLRLPRIAAWPQRGFTLPKRRRASALQMAHFSSRFTFTAETTQSAEAVPRKRLGCGSVGQFFPRLSEVVAPVHS